MSIIRHTYDRQAPNDIICLTLKRIRPCLI